MIDNVQWETKGKVSVIARINGQFRVGITRESRFWQDVEEWLDEGNTPLPADPIAAPGPDPTDDLYARLRALKGTSEIVDQLIDVMTGEGGRGRIAARPAQAT